MPHWVGYRVNFCTICEAMRIGVAAPYVPPKSERIGAESLRIQFTNEP